MELFIPANVLLAWDALRSIIIGSGKLRSEKQGGESSGTCMPRQLLMGSLRNCREFFWEVLVAQGQNKYVPF